MRYLIDTNVISEVADRQPNQRVVRWMDSQPLHDTCLSVLTLGELEKGLAMLAAGPRRAQLRQWLEVDVASAFQGRILPIDAKVARVWGETSGLLERSGRRPKVVDAQMAATAVVHRLTVVTRNVRDFEPFDVEVLNPWDE